MKVDFGVYELGDFGEGDCGSSSIGEDGEEETLNFDGDISESLVAREGFRLRELEEAEDGLGLDFSGAGNLIQF
jgi:hypothetical protein